MNSKESNQKKRTRNSKQQYCRSKKKREDSRKANRIWTYEERCRLAEAVESDKGARFPHFVTKYVGTSKDSEDVNSYRKYYRLVEQGTPFPEFREKAPLDAWINLAEQSARKEDKTAEQCIPQLLTVAALESNRKLDEQPSHNPNYANVYTFLSVILRGEDPPDLPPIDAHVVLSLLDRAVDKLASSVSMLQKEFLHQAFGVLHTSESDNGNINVEPSNKSYPSMNPFNVPLKLLEMRKKQQIILDLGLNWKTGHKNI